MTVLMLVLIMAQMPAAGALSAGVVAPAIPADFDNDAGFIGLADQGPVNQAVRIASHAEFVSVFGSGQGMSNPQLAPSIAAYFANGGGTAWVVRVASTDAAAVVGEDGGSAAPRTGLQIFRDVDEVATIAAPGITALSVQQAMISLCRDRGDCMAILDSASLDDVASALAQRADLDAPDGFGALYFPWVVFDDLGTLRDIPPSGFVSGVYAATPIPRSPVGELALAPELTYNVSTFEQDVLNPEGVNVLRDFTSGGVRIWGARTLATNPEQVFIVVRREANALAEAILDGTQWAIWEENDFALWSALESAIEDFLFDRFREGWFQGDTTSQAYFVRVDSSTTSADDIMAGRTVMLIGFAPVRPAEFVILRLVIDRRGPLAPVFRDGFES